MCRPRQGRADFFYAVLIGLWCVEAAAFPTRPIDLFIGSAPSGSTDALGRVLARSLETVLDQPVVVHNTPGAGGAVMAAQLRNSEPDGYSLGMTISHAYTGNPIVLPRVTTYTVDDFTHLASVSKGQCALVTSTAKPFETLEDVIAAARRGERPVFVSQSPLSRIVVDYIARAEGIEFRVITVQGGGEIMQTILGGHADFGFSGGPHVNFVASGQMRVLASVEDARLLTSPEVPTLRELGYDISSCSTFVVSAPPDLPDEITDALSAALEQAIASPAMTRLIRDLRYPQYYLGPQDVTFALRNEANMLAQASARIEGPDGDGAGFELSPLFMPAVAVILAAGTIALVLIARVRTMLVARYRTDMAASRGALHMQAETALSGAGLSRDSWLFIGTAAAVMAIGFLAMMLLGYIPGAIAVVIGFMALGRADVKVIIGSAIVFPVTLWLLFAVILGFPLP